MSMSTTIHHVEKATVTTEEYEDFSVVLIRLRNADGEKVSIRLFVQEKENLPNILEALANPNQSE